MKHRMVFAALVVLAMAQSWTAQEVVKKIPEAMGSLSAEIIGLAVQMGRDIQSQQKGYMPEVFRPLDERRGACVDIFRHRLSKKWVAEACTRVAGEKRLQAIKLCDDMRDSRDCAQRAAGYWCEQARRRFLSLGEQCKLRQMEEKRALNSEKLYKEKTFWVSCKKRNTAAKVVEAQLKGFGDLTRYEERLVAWDVLRREVAKYNKARDDLQQIEQKQSKRVAWLDRQRSFQCKRESNYAKCIRSIVLNAVSRELPLPEDRIAGLDEQRVCAAEAGIVLEKCLAKAREELKKAEKEVLVCKPEAIVKAEEMPAPSRTLGELWDYAVGNKH